MRRKKLVIISSRIPWPLDKGDKLRLYHQMVVMATHYDLHLIALCHRVVPEDELLPLKQICQSIRLFPLTHTRRYWSMAKAYGGARPLQVSYFFDQIVHQEILHVIDLIRPDLVYCQLIRTALYAQGIVQPVIIDYMDSGGLNNLAAHYQTNVFKRLLLQGETKRIKRFEQQIAPLFKSHTIISTRDRKSIDEPLKDLLTIVSNGVAPSQRSVNYRTSSISMNIGFVGNLSYRHNQLAVDFLIDQILPRLDKSIKVIFAGAGKYVRLLHFKHPQVNYIGYVKNIQEAYDQMSISIAPIFSGSGMQNKVLEAMAHHTPVITTSFVREALFAGENIILSADEPQGFVAHINDLLSHPEKAERIVENAFAFVEKEHNWIKVTQPLIQLIEKHLNE